MKKALLPILIFVVSAITVSSQTANYQVYAVGFAASAHAAPVSFMAEKAPATDSVNMAFMVWLIKGNNGKNILVDAGNCNRWRCGDKIAELVAPYAKNTAYLYKAI